MAKFPASNVTEFRSKRCKQRNKKNVGLEIYDIEPATKNQEIAFSQYEDDKHLFMHGIAGTGKTFLSLFLALRDVLVFEKYRKVIVMRSIVPSRDIGFLPGSQDEKSLPYELPYMNICSELSGRGEAYDILKKHGKLEFLNTSFLRGVTFDNAVIILDEIQNFEDHEINAAMTRIGLNCKVIVCGDFRQTDFRKETEKKGLRNFFQVVDLMPSFAKVEFQAEDICRSDIVKEYILARDKLEL